MRAGDMVGNRYRLDDRIDGGAMGDVWRGHDTRLNRVVAIKLLHSNLSGNSRFRDRFQAEARSVAALQAPGVVSLYDYGEESTPDGLISYLIMELVKGRSLSAILSERGPLPPAQTLSIIAAAADALHAAHQAGIVHRDVKPANMLIDDNGNVKLVDFGIARARGEAGLTETGMVMGTVAYSSPEQLYDSELSGAADVYSLGIVAYECLAGQPPFGSSNPGAVINGHLHQAPPPLPNHVPQPVVDIVMRALSKEPSQRWRSAAELAQVCRDVASGNTTTALLSAPPAATRPMGAATQPLGGTRPTERQQPVRPLPPRSEPEPKRGHGKAIAVVALLLGLVLVGTALAITQPWNTTGSQDQDTSTKKPGGTESNSHDEQSSSDDADEGDTGQPEQSDPQSHSSPESDPGSSSPEEETGPVPNVEGKMYKAAVEALSDAGFDHSEPVYDNDESGDCKVASQDPPANTETNFEDTVTITISGALEPCDRGEAG